ncbi:hypothetical protein [Shewanella sp.]|uniref:hypothetical protein n=1 Tax=Shewanella sp. TaxID=50422 RepID=UPI001EBD07EE|nr:hypothetical protein [Shewanella sp.]NRB22238.1 hypothetical protein [Shewanella sp.]
MTNAMASNTAASALPTPNRSLELIHLSCPYPAIASRQPLNLELTKATSKTLV